MLFTPYRLRSGFNIFQYLPEYFSFPGGSMVKNSPANAGDARDVGLIPGLGRSPGGGGGIPLEHPCLGNCGQRSLASYSPWVCKALDMSLGLSTKRLKTARIYRFGNWINELPGASVRNSACDKGHEEGGLGVCKGRIEPQETSCSRASTPKTRVCLLYCFMLSPTPLTLQGAIPHHLSRRRS